MWRSPQKTFLRGSGGTLRSAGAGAANSGSVTGSRDGSSTWEQAPSSIANAGRQPAAPPHLERLRAV